MIVLASSTDKLEIVLSGAITTNQAQCVCTWEDYESNVYAVEDDSAPETVIALTHSRTVVNTNSTTDVTLVDSPPATIKRKIKTINIYNKDTAQIVCLIKYSDNGTEYILWKKTLATGESFTYDSPN